MRNPTPEKEVTTISYDVCNSTFSLSMLIFLVLIGFVLCCLVDFVLSFTRRKFTLLGKFTK